MVEKWQVCLSVFLHKGIIERTKDVYAVLARPKNFILYQSFSK